MNGKKVLLIESDIKSQELICGFLRDKEYAITCVSSGLDGLGKAQKEKFDIVLLSLEMPDIKDKQIYFQLKRNSRYRNTPIIALSTNDDPDEIQELFEMGIDEYIIKPMRPEYLLERVESLIINNG